MKELLCSQLLNSKSTFETLAHGLSGCATIFDLEKSEQRVLEVEDNLASPDVWNDPALARKLNQELCIHQDLLASWSSVQDKLAELQMFVDMVDDSSQDELSELDKTAKVLDEELTRLETSCLLSGEFDRSTAILTIHSGAGGTDAQDWAEMLMRMYLRWGERSGYKIELADVSQGEEAGIHSATLIVSGDAAFGTLRSERGTHRLVRISPFDQAKRRHTAFAKVEIVPEIEGAEVDVRTEDLKVDTYRSSGAGGQHVNKTESAIRITHIPTGVIVTCQNERSQQANRLTAMRILKAKLYEQQQQERLTKIASIKGDNKEAAWGNQIRSYVLHPYSQVKDRRTGQTDSDVESVLNGKLETFMRAYLEACARLGREPEPMDAQDLD